MPYVADTFHLSDKKDQQKDAPAPATPASTSAIHTMHGEIARTIARVRTLPATGGKMDMHWAQEVKDAADHIYSAFPWYLTREGDEFWEYVWERLGQIGWNGEL